jgi:antitoxin component YwqK of YwqJK toxin-antitoxin module
MKNLISILLFGTLLQGAVAQEFKISHSDVNYFQNTGSFELKDQLANGVYKVYLDSLKTILDYTAEINNQKRTNKWTWYFEDGTKRREIDYQNGVYNGQMISYYPSGQQSVVMSFSEGSQNGLTTRWYQDGAKKFEGSYVNGLPSGLWKFWKEDGSILKEEQH